MKGFILCVLAVLTCVCFYLLKGENKKNRTIIWIIYFLLFAAGFYLVLSVVFYNYTRPHEWDFSAFYLYGKVAAGGHNFYLPENFHATFNSLHLPFSLTNGFVGEVVNIGFPYPPPTILYFAPLGFLSYNTAFTLWTIIILLFLFGSIYLVFNLFFKEYKLNGLILVTTLFFLFSPVRETIFALQTNFILLFLLLLMIKYSNSGFAGIFLAIALFTKPFMIVFILFFLLRKKWKAIIYFIMSSVTLTGLTVALFGTAPFMSYIFNNSVHRLPAPIFSEAINQSLQAVLLRNNILTMEKPVIYIYITACIFLLTVIFLFYLLRKKHYQYMWNVLLLIALILYPGTLSTSGTLLLYIVFQYVDVKNQSKFSMYLNIAIIGIIYFFSPVSIFTCFCLLLIFTILKSLKPPPLNNISLSHLEPVRAATTTRI